MGSSLEPPNQSGGGTGRTESVLQRKRQRLSHSWMEPQCLHCPGYDRKWRLRLGMGDPAGEGILDRNGKMSLVQSQWLLQDSGSELPW